MVKLKSSLNTAAGIAYNSIVSTPFSVIKGIAAAHLIPSSINYRKKLEMSGHLESYIDPDCGQSMSFLDADSLEENYLGKTAKAHPYHMISSLGRMPRKEAGETEQDLTNILQHFVGLIAFCAVPSIYMSAVEQWGSKALAPIALTTALSLAHEIKFNSRLKKSLEVLAIRKKR